MCFAYFELIVALAVRLVAVNAFQPVFGISVTPSILKLVTVPKS